MASATGVGIMFEIDTSKQITIKALVEGGPAHCCNLLAIGDKLLAVDGVDVNERPIASVTERVVGAPRTDVKMLFQRNSAGKMLEVVLTRGVAKPIVEWREIPLNSRQPFGSTAASDSVTDSPIRGSVLFTESNLNNFKAKIDDHINNNNNNINSINNNASKKEGITAPRESDDPLHANKVSCGLTLSKQGKKLVVSDILANSAAEASEAFIEGDEIVEIDGKTTGMMTELEANNLMLGPNGSTIVLSSFSPSQGEIKLVELVRGFPNPNPKIRLFWKRADEVPRKIRDSKIRKQLKEPMDIEPLPPALGLKAQLLQPPPPSSHLDDNAAAAAAATSFNKNIEDTSAKLAAKEKVLKLKEEVLNLREQLLHESQLSAVPRLPPKEILVRSPRVVEGGVVKPVLIDEGNGQYSVVRAPAPTVVYDEELYQEVGPNQYKCVNVKKGNADATQMIINSNYNNNNNNSSSNFSQDVFQEISPGEFVCLSEHNNINNNVSIGDGMTYEVYRQVTPQQFERTGNYVRIRKRMQQQQQQQPRVFNSSAFEAPIQYTTQPALLSRPSPIPVYNSVNNSSFFSSSNSNNVNGSSNNGSTLNQSISRSSPPVPKDTNHVESAAAQKITCPQCKTQLSVSLNAVSVICMCGLKLHNPRIKKNAEILSLQFSSSDRGKFSVVFGGMACHNLALPKRYEDLTRNAKFFVEIEYEDTVERTTPRALPFLQGDGENIIVHRLKNPSTVLFRLCVQNASGGKDVVLATTSSTVRPSTAACVKLPLEIEGREAGHLEVSVGAGAVIP